MPAQQHKHPHKHQHGTPVPVFFHPATCCSSLKHPSPNSPSAPLTTNTTPPTALGCVGGKQAGGCTAHVFPTGLHNTHAHSTPTNRGTHPLTPISHTAGTASWIPCASKARHDSLALCANSLYISCSAATSAAVCTIHYMSLLQCTACCKPQPPTPAGACPALAAAAKSPDLHCSSILLYCCGVATAVALQQAALQAGPLLRAMLRRNHIHCWRPGVLQPGRAMSCIYKTQSREGWLGQHTAQYSIRTRGRRCKHGLVDTCRRHVSHP